MEKNDEDKFDERGYDSEGFSRKGYDRRGFNREGINKHTGTKYSKHGYDFDGWNIDGWNSKNINKKTGTKYDEENFNRKGLDPDGYDREGRKRTGKYGIGSDRQGYLEDGFHYLTGFNKEGIHKETGTRYNQRGRDVEGYDKQGEDYKGNLRPISDDVLAGYGVDLINYYIESDYTSMEEMFKKDKNVTKERFEIVRNALKNANPVLYEELSDKIQNKNKKRFAILNNKLYNIVNKINTGIECLDGSFRKYEYFDLILESGYDINTFIELYDSLKIKYKLDNNEKANVSTFIKKCLSSSKRNMNIDDIYNSYYAILIDGNPHEVPKTKKEETVEFMKKNKLPMQEGIYNSLIREYAKGNIEYDYSEIVNIKSSGNKGKSR